MTDEAGSMGGGDDVQRQLAAARDQLLDLTPRNRLLNYRPTKRTTVRITDELPTEVWRRLVEDGRTMQFLAAEEQPSERVDNGESQQCDWPAAAVDEALESRAFSLPKLEPQEGETSERHVDRFLQSEHGGDELQTNLLQTYRAANQAIDERGVNLLYLAIGSLRWQDPDDAKKRWFDAPIVLLPVQLERTSARRRFRLSVSGDDPVLNPCLLRKLEDMHVEAPAEPADWAEFDLGALLKSFEALAEQFDGWSVSGAMTLGLFSFTKYLMYVDLDMSRWPADQAPTGSAVFRAMCGDNAVMDDEAEDAGALPDAAQFDAQRPPLESFEVMDADSSQLRAVVAAKQGRSLVIEGPPGTGKSQTIANIIAECLADGKTVLFVSQKLAALEVVERRLHKVGLGDFCLELHSTKATRQSVLDQIERAIARPSNGKAGDEGAAAQLLSLRQRLNGYVRALHDPIEPTGLSPYRVIGRLSLLEAAPAIACKLPGFETWDDAKLRALKDAVEVLSRHTQVVFPQAEHAWHGVRLTTASSQTAREAAQRLRLLRARLSDLQDASSAVTTTLEGMKPKCVDDVRQQLDAASALLQMPRVPQDVAEQTGWSKADAQRERLIGEVISPYRDLQNWLGGKYKAERVEAVDWAGMDERSSAHWRSILRYFRPSFWRDRNQHKLSLEAGYTPTTEQAIEDIAKLAQVKALQAQLAADDEPGRQWFGSLWQGEASDFTCLLEVAEAMPGLAPFVVDNWVGNAGLALVAQEPGQREALAGEVDGLGQAAEAWHAAWSGFAAMLQFDDRRGFADGVAEAAFDAIDARLVKMAGATESLLDWCQFQRSLQPLEDGPLADFIGSADADQLEPELLALAFERAYLQKLIDKVFADREPLGQFNTRDHEAEMLEFAQCDKQWIADTGGRLCAKLAATQPATHFKAASSSQLGILQSELRRKRGGRPLRRLFADASTVLQKLKPCMMMSPLSVAQFIEPGAMQFDVVIFDEASQVEPADALGAIARGKQLLLVGDPKQLPPTQFFEAAVSDSRDEGDDGAASLTDMESILDRGSIVLPSVRLRWHYRSRHESLIAFSNEAFYDSQLVVFPSSHTDASEYGVDLRYEPNDLYERGGSRTNPQQAKRVAQWVFEHARMHPELSLGVGTFSVAQQQAVLDEIESLRREDDSLEAFFDRGRDEPFFVKNLETIQGDERDVILLSVGYGRDEPGERVAMNFGPLNADGGWRRLNVLLTRAKRRCVVFTSILGHDLDLGATGARGVHALKQYFDYLQSGELREDDDEQDADHAALVQSICNELVDRDYDVRTGVGVGAHAMDIAVVDPRRPDSYLMGIEVDGARYRGSPTSRDRNRTRPSVLEALGWNVHHIWAPDWLRRRRGEVERLVRLLDKAKRGEWRPRFINLPIETAAPAVDEAMTLVEQLAPIAAAIPTEPYRVYSSRRVAKTERFYTDPMRSVRELVQRIVACEGPVHHEELARRVAAQYQLTRVGSRVQQRVDLAVSQLVDAGEVRRVDWFLWPAEMDEPPVRVREDERVRDIDLICDEEIARAARLLVEAQMDVSRDELITQTARVLGFASTGSKIAERVDRAVTSLVSAGALELGETGLLKRGEGAGA